MRFHNIALFFPFLNITSQKRKFIYTKKQFGDFFGLCPDLENYYLSFSKRESTCNCDFKASYYWTERKKRKKLYLIKFNHFVGRKIPKSWFAFLGWNKEMKICLTYWTVSSQFKYWFISLLSKHLSKSILYEKIKLCIQNKTNLIKDSKVFSLNEVFLYWDIWKRSKDFYKRRLDIRW